LRDDLKPRLEEKAIKFLIEDTKKNDKVKRLIFNNVGYRALWKDNGNNVYNFFRENFVQATLTILITAFIQA